MASAEPRPPDLDATPFLLLSALTSRRLQRAAWLRAVRASTRSVVALLLLALAVAVFARWNEHPNLLAALLPITGGSLLLGLLVLRAHFWLRRADPATALAVFDERSGNQERFLSAYCFALEEGRDAGANLHVRRALPHVEVATARLAEVLPLRPAPALFVLAPALLTVLWLLSPGRVNPVRPVPTSQPTPARSAEADAAPPTAAPQSVRARHAAEAARLAAHGEPQDEQADRALLSALVRHADTAPLATALTAGRHAEAADQARRLARRLRADNLSKAARQRIESALQDSLEAATASHKKTPLGVQLKKAHQALGGNRREQAAAALEQIAKRLRRVDQNTQAKAALDRVADSHRRKSAPKGEPRRLPGLPPDRLTGRSTRPATALPGDRPGTRPGQPGAAGGPASDGDAGENAPGEGTADGLRPGVGSAPYGAEPTAPLPATHDEAVPARVAASGRTERRREDPPAPRTEDPPAPVAPVDATFSTVSEAARVSDPLPLSKQALVMQYLRALRKRFEAAEHGRKR